MFVASTILIKPVGFSSRINRLETSSSLVYGESEYMPGRSVTFVFAYPRIEPSFRSTVTPGKFTTC